MPAVPALIMAGGSVVSSIAAGKARKAAMQQAMQRSPEELALMQSQTRLGDQMRGQGQQLFQTGMPQLQATIDYYRTLLDGSRAARMNAVSGEAQDTAAAFQGSETAINKNLRGGERDQALAENARQRAGNISRLVTGVRPGAAAALGGLGTQLVGGSQAFEGTAADINANLLGNSTANRQGALRYGENAADTTSENLGKLFGSIAGAWKMGGKKPLPSRPVANLPSTVPLPAGSPGISGLSY